MKIEMKHGLWSCPQTLRVDLPARWDVRMLRMRGDDQKVLETSDYRQAFGSLKTTMRGKKRVAVVFDDLSRPTRIYQFIPFLLELFEECGISDDQVRFICAAGTHAALDNTGFRRKLGKTVLDRFPVYTHHPYENCKYLGKTRLGTPILVNQEYLSCDLKIGIGSLLQHAFCGHGGGYKIVMPGLAHIDAIAHHHGILLSQHCEFGIMGKSHGNPLLEDVKEFGRVAGLDISIDLLVNADAEAVDIYAGEPEGMYGSFAARAVSHYATEVPGKADIVIANTYCKGNEAGIAISFAEQVLRDEGGDVVLLCDIPEGQVIHYLFGRFGESIWGRAGIGEKKNNKKIRRLFVFSRYRDIAGSFWFGRNEDISWHQDLSEIIDILDQRHRMGIPEVFVIPDGTIQTVDFVG